MKTWSFQYKGHHITVTNGYAGETLQVDGETQDAGLGLCLRSRLYGKIRSGEGAGEQVKASLGGWLYIRCVVFVDHREVFRS